MAFLVILLYFLIFSWTAIGVIIFLIALLGLFKNYTIKRILQTLGLLGLFTLYFSFLNLQQIRDNDCVPDIISYIQMIPDTISVNGDLLSFQGKSDGYSYQVFYTLKTQEEQEFFKSIDKTLILKIQGSAQEATLQRNFNGFDYQDFLKHKGIYRIVTIDVIEKIEEKNSLSFFQTLRQWRRKAIVTCQQRFPSPMNHYMTGLLFGYLDKSFDEMVDIYSSLGIIHLFALSGMHVNFFVKIFRYVFLRMGVRTDYVDYLQVVASVCYAALTGFSVSVIRNLIQKNLAIVGLRKLNNFAVTIIIVFFLVPHFLMTVGGLLSFAYAFILSFTDFEDFGKYKTFFIESLTLSLGILPLLIYCFSSLQPFSILLTFIFSTVFNFLILPLLTIVFILLPVVKLNCFNLFFELLEKLLTWTGQVVGRPLVFGQPSFIVLVLLLIFLGLLYDFHQKKKLALTLSMIIAFLLFQVKNPLVNEVTIVDIGQGDSIFIRDITGKNIVIDVGGKMSFSQKESWQDRITSSNAERTLILYLKSRGISKIDQLVLTHTDADHVGDLEVVAQHFKIGEILTSPGSLTNARFLSRLKRLAVNVRVIQSGDKLPIMSSQLQVLYPNQIGDGGNDDSIVLYGALLGKNFLFTGDLEEVGEQKLIKAYPNLPVDVLKAGHHGSKGSSSMAFLEHVNPQITLISVGKDNRYKHPHMETLERLAEIDDIVFRTDEQGAIRLYGWNNWSIETVR